ncbi:hypothetical protein [Pararhodospirillum photometricum]|uniref:Uncharacterized protein n=1 Tax=Pararhodospirillum photometricum DSM 122 TaxID=1150469 RepID=H6SRC5_PARPM|nr:hypothetical protein [Pararhodospirillum photometricum]CCG09847.1 unnamed protein product [Pararhodospirillum photometricum DSM 122]
MFPRKKLVDKPRERGQRLVGKKSRQTQVSVLVGIKGQEGGGALVRFSNPSPVVEGDKSDGRKIKQCCVSGKGGLVFLAFLQQGFVLKFKLDLVDAEFLNQAQRLGDRRHPLG